MTSATFDRRRARLSAYASWIFRDYATNQGPSTILVVLMIGFLTLLPVMQGMTGSSARFGEVPLLIAQRMLLAIVPPLVFLGTFFATNGIIANDRKFGFYRFLFAKPVSPPRYYATVFVVYGAGLLIVTLVLVAAWAVAVRPMFPLALLAVVPLMYVAYGGIGFLLSAAWRFDWLSLVSVLLVANVGWSVWGTAEGLRRWVLYLLPPVHRANEVYALVVREPQTPVPWDAIAWFGGYGLLCFALGMLVIRRRSLGTS